MVVDWPTFFRNVDQSNSLHRDACKFAAFRGSLGGVHCEWDIVFAVIEEVEFEAHCCYISGYFLSIHYVQEGLLFLPAVLVGRLLRGSACGVVRVFVIPVTRRGQGTLLLGALFGSFGGLAFSGHSAFVICWGRCREFVVAGWVAVCRHGGGRATGGSRGSVSLILGC